jgi:hypothetical protein
VALTLISNFRINEKQGEKSRIHKKCSKKQLLVEIISPNSILGMLRMEHGCRPGADAAAGASSP